MKNSDFDADSESLRSRYSKENTGQLLNFCFEVIARRGSIVDKKFHIPISDQIMEMLGGYLRECRGSACETEWHTLCTGNNLVLQHKNRCRAWILWQP